MNTVHKLIRKRLLENIPDRIPDLTSLKKTERSQKFEELCMNRKIMGAFRYGLMGAEDKTKYDRISDMVERLEKYKKDKNAEHLVDVANLAELEFAEGDWVWLPSDDGEHTKC